jgi:putative transposase
LGSHCFESYPFDRETAAQELLWRWIVERAFGWLNRSRRLSKDFEALPETTETWIRIAMIQLMTKRLAAKT